MDLLIKKGRIIDPSSKLDKIADILIEDGTIKAIEENIPKKDISVWDANGKLVLPAFVDLHCHLREPGQEHKETLTSGAMAGVAGGFCTLFAMPNTSPPLDDKTRISYVLKKSEDLPLYVFPIGALTQGMKEEQLSPIAELAEAGAKALSDDGHPIQNSNLLRNALLYAKMFKLPVMLHCEDISLSRGGVANEGYTSTRLGLRGIPKSAEEVGVARAIILALETGSRVHICHISTKRSLELVKWGKEKGAPITCEVTPHHLILTDEAIEGYNTRAKCNPPLRTEEDRIALIEGLLDGTIDCIATDHAPHSPDEWDVEFDLAPFGIAGLETSFPILYTHLVEPGFIPLELLVDKMSTSPAKLMGLEQGKIEVGKEANLTIIDTEVKEVRTVNLFSKGKNNPFVGWKLKGFPCLTICKGKIVFERREFL
ncbi:dihydroorotase [bacterium]|nr:dihydroorotase [bacterium]